MSGNITIEAAIERTLKTVMALENGVTAPELAKILKLSSSNCAQKWIDAASLTLPVIEIGKKRNKRTYEDYSTIYGFVSNANST